MKSGGQRIFGRIARFLTIAVVSFTRRRASVVQGFAHLSSTSQLHRSPIAGIYAKADDFKEEAEQLLARAKELRSEIGKGVQPISHTNPHLVKAPSHWNVPAHDNESTGYRLKIDLGREEGTWMDPRWGESGRRIEFSIDVAFLLDVEAAEQIEQRMIKDNFGGKSSSVKSLLVANNARLRNGFDRMACQDGGYRIDVGRNGASTVRFFVSVDGTRETGSSYGDISVPKGALYFFIPCFHGGVSQLSTKEGPVTVRQVDWHTGWRREESRIVGTFRAVPINKAQAREGF